MNFTKYLIPMEDAQEGLLSNLKDKMAISASEQKSKHRNQTLETAMMNVRNVSMFGTTGIVYGVVTGGTFKAGHAMTTSGQPIIITHVNSQNAGKSPMSVVSLGIAMPIGQSNLLRPGVTIVQQNWVDKKESE